MGFWSSFGSSALDSTVGGLLANAGMVDYYINPLAQYGYDQFWNDSYSMQSEWNQKNAAAMAALQYGYWKQSQIDGPGLRREGLVKAGYNPILAVSSASGQPFSNSLPSLPSAQSGPTVGRALSTMAVAQQAAMVDQTNAQTDFIKRRTLGEGWQVKTLSRSEAQGLGANLIHTLGFNFHDSSQETFLVAYNPITGELRNLGDTSSGLGTTGETTNAAQVDVEVDGKPHSTHLYRRGSSESYFSKFFHDTPRSPLR